MEGSKKEGRKKTAVSEEIKSGKAGVVGKGKDFTVLLFPLLSLPLSYILGYKRQEKDREEGRKGAGKEEWKNEGRRGGQV